MPQDFPAQVSATINAPISSVWDALVNPAVIKKYFFGTEAISDWKAGSSIVFRGEWQGKTYEDKGTILRIEPEKLLEYTHWSNLSGLSDRPENYHTVTFTLTEENGGTKVSLIQSNNPTEESRDHSAKNWEMVFAAMKKILES